MSPYYDQPTLRQRGPEDVAGVLVLIACAALAFAWYVAVSRLHLRNQQCLKSSCTPPSCFSAEACSSHNWLVETKERGELATPRHPDSGIERRGNSQ